MQDPGMPCPIQPYQVFLSVVSLVMFPSPDTFRPERFLETDDPRLKSFDLCFGFGRRICPGMHLALNSLFINISRILWAFDITPVKGPDGKPILPGSPRKKLGLLLFIHSYNLFQTPGTTRMVSIQSQ